MPDATFTRPDLTTFTRLDGLGLEVTGQLLEPDRSVLACRVVEPDDWCRRWGLMHDQVSHDLWRRAALQGRMCAMPAPYPQEFREDVVRVARNREPGQKLSVIAKDFGISESCLTNWMRQADVEDGNRPGKTREDSTELRELRRRNRLLEQENEVLRRAAAYLSQANLPGKFSTRS